jgi:hypothetical protein
MPPFKKQASFKTRAGASITVDLSRARLNDNQKAAMRALLQHGSVRRLDAEQVESLKRARLGLGDVASGPIIRFDLKAVRIDRPQLDGRLVRAVQRRSRGGR